MIYRVTESMKYDVLTSSIFNVQGKSANLMEKISTQKNINRPSDDPVGVGKVLNYTSTVTSIEQYQSNITNAETWLALTDTTLSSIRDLISTAQDIAGSQSGADGSNETMDSSADVVSGLIDSALSLMNTKQGDSYIFGGSRTDVSPFTLTPTATTIGNPAGTATNVFTGTVTKSGTYTGSEDKTYAVKIVDPGVLGTATCKISSDGGKTWSDTQNIPLVGGLGVLDLGDGVKITFDDLGGTKSFATNDLFTVNASVDPFIGTASAATANTFNGTVTYDGTYTGTENKTYVLKIIGGNLTSAQYQISSDGGEKWGGTQTANFSAPLTLTLDDGVKMKFTAGTDIAAGDLFTVNAYAAGYYQGDDNDLKVQIGKNNNFIYNITGSDAFTAANGPSATAVINNAGALTVEDTITLTRGDSAGSWTITNHDQYPDMVITSMSDTQITIDADNDTTTTPDITLNLSDGEWQKGNTATFTILKGGGATLLTQTPVLSSVEVEGPGTVDLLGTLNALKSALQAHDQNAIAAQIDDLKDIQTQVLQAQTNAGSKSSSLELTKTSLTALNEQITSMKANIEDADLDKLIISYQLEQIALEASYNLAAQIGKMTILDYLR
ncbi:MAG: flagellin [Smithella sp.]